MIDRVDRMLQLGLAIIDQNMDTVNNLDDEKRNLFITRMLTVAEYTI